MFLYTLSCLPQLAQGLQSIQYQTKQYQYLAYPPPEDQQQITIDRDYAVRCASKPSVTAHTHSCNVCYATIHTNVCASFNEGE